MGKQDPKSPAPAEFYPIDINRTAEQARQADIAAYGRSDEDFSKRFPGLVRGESVALDSAYKNLTGPLDPDVQSSFVNEGLVKSLNSFGGGQAGAAIGGKGSASRNTVASTFANNVLEKQDYDRGVFNQSLATNLPRAIGPSGEDAVSWLIKNTGDQNQINQSNYVGSVNAQNAQNAADAANTQAAIGTALAVAGLVAAI